MASESVILTAGDTKPSAQSRFLRSRAAAQYLGISEWTIRELAHAGELRYIQRTPRSPFLFDVQDLEEWAERNKR